MNTLRSLLIVVATASAVALAYDIRSEPQEQRQMIWYALSPVTVRVAPVLTPPYSNNQIATCNNACVQKTVANSCDVSSMIWQCVCAGNRVPQPSGK